MKSPLAQDTTKSAKAMAQQIAKQMAREPLEILKTAGEQTFGPEAPRTPENQLTGQEYTSQEQLGQKEELDSLKSSRRVEALNRELEDIRKQDLVHDLQKRISDGEDISLEEYPELTIEQKQVLKAQKEAVRSQNSKLNAQDANVLIEPSAKPSRRFGPTRKQEAEKQQTRVEKPVPPSG